MLNLTKAQKRAVVVALMDAAGNIAETWGESDYAADLRAVPADLGVAYLASLMRRLPGKVWDDRLGDL